MNNVTLRTVLGCALTQPLKTAEAWQYLLNNGKMDPWTATVHKYVFDVLLTVRLREVIDCVTDVMDSNETMLLMTFRGLLRDRLPKLNLGIKQDEPQRRRAQVLASKLVTNVLIDQGILQLEVKRGFTQEGQPVVQEYVALSGVNRKNRLRGVMTDPGKVLQKEVAGRSLTKRDKSFLKLLSTPGYVLHEDLDTDLLWRFYKLKDDWNRRFDKNGDPIRWGRSAKKLYYTDTAESIMDLKDCVYHLSHKFDGRKRVYPDAARQEGVRVLGKEFETSQHCSARSYAFNDESYGYLIQQLYAAREDRAGVEESVALIRPEHFEPVTKDMLLAATSQKEMGKLWTAKKALESLERLDAGVPCNNLFGIDQSFGGGGYAGLLFKSPEFLELGNLYGGDEAVDAHTVLANGFGVEGVDRDVMKKQIVHGVVHAESYYALASKLTEFGIEMTEQEVGEALVRAAGPCVRNIDIIGSWGAGLSRSQYNIMRWTMPDGIIASHRAYQTGIPVESYVASARHESRYQHLVQVTDMPYTTTNSGKRLYRNPMQLGKTSYPIKTHLRGLYADIIHSFDAYTLRCVVRAVTATGMPILVKHDNFYVHPTSMTLVINTMKKVFKEILASDYLEGVLKEIADRAPGKVTPPQLEYGNAEDRIDESKYFLLP